LTSIAAELGAARTTVSHALRRQGITPPPVDADAIERFDDTDDPEVRRAAAARIETGGHGVG
jgi:hypothetical protein